MASCHVSQLETRTEATLGPAENKLKAKAIISGLKELTNPPTRQPGSAKAAQTISLKLPGGSFSPFPLGKQQFTASKSWPTAMVKPGLQHLQQSQSYNFPSQLVFRLIAAIVTH